MVLFFEILKTLFGIKKKQGRVVENPTNESVMKVVHNNTEDNPESEVSSAVNELSEPNPQVCNDVRDKPNEFSEPQQKKKRVKNVVGQKTLSEIRDYLLTYGSINTLTCREIFAVKSLHNFIWQLRKDGLEIETKKVNILDESGQQKQIASYILISQK